MAICIHLNKVEVLVGIVQNFVSREKVTLKEIQSLVGTLNFFCKAIRSSRELIRRMYDSMCGVFKQICQLVLRVTLTCS